MRYRLFVLCTLLLPAATPVLASERLSGGLVFDFPADPASLGSIPDSPVAGCGTSGSPRDVIFNVSGWHWGAPGGVEVTIVGNHSWVGDLLAVLIAPDGTSFDVFGRTGVTTATGCGDSSNFAGPYTFSDGATSPPFGGWWQAATAVGTMEPVATGTYWATQRGGAETPNPAPATSLIAAFAGVADPNGTWLLRLTDWAGEDTGQVTSAMLTLRIDSIFADRFEDS